MKTFEDMGLPEHLLRGIYSYGFEKPSAIQQRACKPTMLGKDLIAQAQSGTVRFPSIVALDVGSFRFVAVKTRCKHQKG